ncbi:MAG: hypothetical protein RL660_388 [Bacteroidota bacterium]|jgi:hypothetical protein
MKPNSAKHFYFFVATIILSMLTVTVNAQTKASNKVVQKSTAKRSTKKKELVYLYAANGGMVGYFSDGSVVECPRCDFCRSNILAMFKEKPMRQWDLKKPKGFVSYKVDNGWVLIKYKWKEKVPQF